MTFHTLALARNARVLIAVAVAALGAGSALAEKPPWAGGEGKGRGDAPPGQMKHRNDDAPGRMKHDDARRDRWQHEEPRRARADRDRRAPPGAVHPGSHFNDTQRRQVRQWYGDQYRAGHCPPGLAKKHNGCMPPGQAKKWRVGHVLPASVTYYAVPQPVLVQLGPPPAGYRYVRVADDILLLSLGTRMVIDAITNLGGF